MYKSRALRSSLSLVLLAGALTGSLGCKPKAVRGGPGTDNPNLDEGAMGTGLDRVDIDYLVDQNLSAMFASGWWARDVQGSPGGPPIVAIWPIKNATSHHLDDQMLTLLSQIETTLVNSGAVSVVSRERQAEMVAEAQLQNTDIFDPSAARIGAQLGAKYYITGKLTSNEERIDKERRVQYSLFLQVIEVETSLVKFQFTSERSKAIVR
jgi:penicillin-binding protein activator